MLRQTARPFIIRMHARQGQPVLHDAARGSRDMLKARSCSPNTEDASFTLALARIGAPGSDVHAYMRCYNIDRHEVTWECCWKHMFVSGRVAGSPGGAPAARPAPSAATTAAAAHALRRYDSTDRARKRGRHAWRACRAERRMAGTWPQRPYSLWPCILSRRHEPAGLGG